MKAQDADDGPDAAAIGTDVFAADDGIGGDLARVDWSATPLGPPDGWPQSLRTAVSILLSSRFSMWMAWGPELTFFCNSAYRTGTLGRKYPWALGRPAREVWAEIWSDIGPRIEGVMTTGRATWDEALLLFLERSGYTEETYHTFSYSPLHDDDGQVVGMLCVVSEETERVIGERRMATLRDLGSDPSVVRTEQQMLDFSARQMDRNPRDLPFTLTYLHEDDGTARLACSTGIAPGHALAPAFLPATGQAAPWPVSATEPVLIDLDTTPHAGPRRGDWSLPPLQALLVPLQQQGVAPHGFLVVGLNRFRTPDESYRGFVELVAGHVAAGTVSARSYQAQQRRADELAELDRAKTAFFSNISHEFRTPLTLIMGPVEELRHRLEDADPLILEELDVIRRNGVRLGKLVNSLLDFSRIEAGRAQAHYEPVDLARATAELASVFRSAVDRAGLGYDVDCPPLSRPVHVDPAMWEKVMLNLLSNAVKFTFDGSITVRVREESGRAVVTVADTGVGVSEQERPRLFDRFHRIENARSRSHEGSGIGLALVRELVELHGGTIGASSAEGVGTTFTITLPFGTAHLPADAAVGARTRGVVSTTAAPYVEEALHWLPPLPAGAEAALPTVESSDPVAADRPPTDARVLVVDDNADMREYLARLMTGAGYRVTTVVDGTGALESVRADPPDLVVSDVMMPGLDGLGLVAALRSDPRTVSVPVVLLSARAGQEASIEGLRSGADDYLVKPFAAAELLARVRANIQLARLRDHHARWHSALVDSLQEAFFVCDEDGAVIEINTAFTEILGYEPEGLPYRPVHPWWPDPAAEPEAHQEVGNAFGRLLRSEKGSYTVPVNHRDGHRLWVAVTFNQVDEPDTGRRLIVGTLRDVTAEHYAIQRESALASLSTLLSRASGLPEALSGALEELHDLWHAACVLAVVLGDEAAPVLTATDGSRWQELPAGLRDALVGLGTHPKLSPVGAYSGTAIVLEHPDGPMVLWLDLGERRPFTGEDELLLSLLAGHLAQGLARVHQIDQQRETAIALQRAILGPSHLPTGFAVRYEPATQPLEVGGDWYDTVPLPDGRIGIVVGDCVGRGLEAAAVMGQLRSACRALLLQNAVPAEVLTALDHFAAGIQGAACTTVFCGVLDSESGQLVYSSAGHPPGILVEPDGTTRLLEEGRATPLAVRPGAPRPEGRYVMPARSTLLLYTDGLVERRRRSLDVGIGQTAAAVQDGRDAAVDELASHVMDRLAPDGGYDDDVALLVYRHPAPLDITFPAESSQLAPVRKALRGWLAQCELPRHIAQNILVAAGEACANAVEHGHRTSSDTVQLRAEARVDKLHVSVVDTGRWRPPEPAANPHRGRGLILMRALMQRVTVTPGPVGTVVDMQARIA
ncbi:PAS/PAC sensor hybrid histidine kinase [Actinacidiphila alni]|uniref:histidine kinase n=1 Tax=Actinacidiphila alni TaxID=380248 RepID=A0A1I2H025_9ACTN|nr:SpoIIE family protein phosphatase [Actinacidiphila alni]SFF23594.1 PAS/PAC sensor hybrid histidine kinase [Actinacidiphila alni]